MFQNRVLIKILGPKREEERSWRKWHNTVRVIKSRRRWAGHAARMGRVEVFKGFVGRIILRWAL
jgi:hypothetical protein